MWVLTSPGDCVEGDPQPVPFSSSTGVAPQPVLFSSSTGAAHNRTGEINADDPKWNIVVVVLAAVFALACLIGLCAAVAAKRARDARLLAEKHDSRYERMINAGQPAATTVGHHDRSYLEPLA